MRFAILFFLPLALCSTIIRSVSSLTPPLPSRTLFRFEDVGTWIENVVVRANGDLLFTMTKPGPYLYTVKDPQSPSPEVSLVYEFPNITGLLGIAETYPDVFAVVGGRFDGIAVPIPNSFSLWRIDFNTCNDNMNTAIPAISKVVDLPGYIFPNGVESTPSSPDIILVANSLGSLLRVDTLSKTIITAVNVTEMAPVPDAPLPIGINGIKIHGDRFYWSNSFASTIYSLPLAHPGLDLSLSLAAQPASLKVDLVADLPATFIDDFAIGHDGTIWATTNANNTVIAISGVPEGGRRKQLWVVAGAQDSEALAGADAGAFGRTAADRDVLYAVTTGGLASPVNGTLVEPAKVLAINTAGFRPRGIVAKY
ncbi:hypothetical protein BX600DRAFT_507170 [Xylariales sp. PMI_506]|nr:hypothetical protein BX600DRAFT_507170 [Xylariales sp. PMI_506]